MNKAWKITLGSFLLLTVLTVLAILPTTDKRVHLVFCDVGQGDGILIAQQNVQVVVDTGPDQKMLGCLGNHIPFWDRKIDFLMVTNPDLDHYGGLLEILRNYEVGEIGVPDVGKHDISFEELEKEVESKKIKVVKLKRGDKIKIGELRFDIVWPYSDAVAALPDEEQDKRQVLGVNIAAASPNEFSIVALFSYGAFQALLTGDIVPPATDTMSQLLNGSVELLKVPHHGSKNGLTEKLLENSKPQVAVISAGRNNRFGHPHQETLGLLEQFAVKTLGTYEKGEIQVKTDGKTWSIKN